MRSVLTTCGYCGCGCNLYYAVNGGEIVSVLPKTDHPVSRGKLCVKGWTGHGFVRHPDRLAHPLIRDAKGRLARAAWDEALSLVASRLREIARESGPESIGVLSSARCTNEENYLAARLARAALGTPNIDHCARL
jgi:predicted molibdopterin-dependent oxidoreductase YjgC